MHAHPDWQVDYTYYDAHGDDETRAISIRQLASEHLDSLESATGDCEPELKERLRAATE